MIVACCNGVCCVANTIPLSFFDNDLKGNSYFKNTSKNFVFSLNFRNILLDDGSRWMINYAEITSAIFDKLQNRTQQYRACRYERSPGFNKNVLHIDGNSLSIKITPFNFFTKSKFQSYFIYTKEHIFEILHQRYLSDYRRQASIECECLLSALYQIISYVYLPY